MAGGFDSPGRANRRQKYFFPPIFIADDAAMECNLTNPNL